MIMMIAETSKQTAAQNLPNFEIYHGHHQFPKTNKQTKRRKKKVWEKLAANAKIENKNERNSI